MFRNSLRAKLRGGSPAFGMFVAIEDPAITEISGELGLDWLCIDMEHGHLDFRDLLNHLRAARGSSLSVLCRLPTTSVDHVKRALDLGAQGVVLPLIETAEELEQGIGFARYPPKGVRGLSNMRAASYGPMLADYVALADEETLVIPILETAMATRNIDEILAVEGLEAVFFGPADLSQSYGHRGVWEGPGVAERILQMAKKANDRNIATAIMGLDVADIEKRLAQGFKIVGIGSDIMLLMKQIDTILQKFGKAGTQLAFAGDSQRR